MRQFIGKLVVVAIAVGAGTVVARWFNPGAVLLYEEFGGLEGLGAFLIAVIGFETWIQKRRPKAPSTSSPSSPHDEDVGT